MAPHALHGGVRGPKQRDLDQVLPAIRAVKALGLETCGTFGLLKPGRRTI